MARPASISYRLAKKIREFWRDHPQANLFHTPTVGVNELDFAIESDMINGWPPLRGKK